VVAAPFLENGGNGATSNASNEQPPSGNPTCTATLLRHTVCMSKPRHEEKEK
jgi:hypothetical protein